MGMMKSILLLSGGIDSALAGALEREKGFSIYALTVDYGQTHRREIEAAKLIALWLKANEHRIIEFDLRQLAKGPLLGGAAHCRTLEEIRQEPSPAYVPARNSILLSIALAYADVIGERLRTRIVIGPNCDDALGFIDCRRSWIEAAARLALVATKTAPGVVAPLLGMRKPQVVLAASRAGIPLADTFSCYQPIDSRHCGQCDACLLRRDAFIEAAVPDPSDYVC